MKSKCKNCFYKELNLSSSNCEDCVRFINYNFKEISRSVTTILKDLYNFSLKIAVHNSQDEYMIILPSKHFFNIFDTFSTNYSDRYDLDRKLEDFDVQTISNLFNVKL